MLLLHIWKPLFHTKNFLIMYTVYLLNTFPKDIQSLVGCLCIKCPTQDSLDDYNIASFRNIPAHTDRLTVDLSLPVLAT